jgi:hypothetical protein
MNEEAYRELDYEEIITKNHYYQDWQNNKFVLIPSNHLFIGKEVSFKWIFEKVYLEDLRPLNDNEIVNKEHFEVWRDDYGNLRMAKCDSYFFGKKAGDARKECSHVPEYNIYA